MIFLTPENLSVRRDTLAAAISPAQVSLAIHAGEPLGKPGGLDQCYPFRPHPEYYWLTGVKRPGGVMAFSPAEGWTHFVVPVSDTERLWVADEPTPAGEPIERYSDWLSKQDKVLHFGACPVELATSSKERSEIQFQLDAVRRRKDAFEVALVRRAAEATAAGFAAAQLMIQPGISEREIQIELEAAMLRAGATAMGYDTIIAVGSRAAVLHCQPGAARVAEANVVLIDAGGEIDFYTADVTRSYPAEPDFTDQQQAIYQIVLNAELAGVDACRVGTEWHDVHRTAARVMAEGLISLGILTCSLEQALEDEVIWMFFPHGIGHTVGLGVRDVGGHAPDRPADRTCCGATPRIDLPLEVGHLVTVEPGIYFVPAILDNEIYRNRHRDAVDWDELEKWRSVGGIRIEDNILVTESEPDVLTAMIPK